jgi:CheY-like chemotaxis protein
MVISVGLVVDDDPHRRRLLSEALRREGICVLEAKSGREALKLTQTAVPHFVVTDIEMPDVGGLELCRRLRQLTATSNVPIIIVSSAAAGLGEDATAAGCDVVLPKSCSPALLLATIQRLLVKPSGSKGQQ